MGTDKTAPWVIKEEMKERRGKEEERGTGRGQAENEGGEAGTAATQHTIMVADERGIDFSSSLNKWINFIVCKVNIDKPYFLKTLKINFKSLIKLTNLCNRIKRKTIKKQSPKEKDTITNQA